MKFMDEELYSRDYVFMGGAANFCASSKIMLPRSVLCRKDVKIYITTAPIHMSPRDHLISR